MPFSLFARADYAAEPLRQRHCDAIITPLRYYAIIALLDYAATIIAADERWLSFMMPITLFD
jgi:hypothetical protein